MKLFRPWASLCVLTQAWAAIARDENGEFRSIALRTHSIAPPYLDSDMQSRWFEFGGDTIVRTDQYIRLTSDVSSQSGWLFSRIPLTATNWEIEVEFKIDGVGNLHGDGMAMWLTKQRGTTGPVFGSTDLFEGLGIFIDTYKNNRPGIVFPLVMAMVGDGQTRYDNANDGKANELASCSARGIRGSHVPTKARLTYFQDRWLKLDLHYKNEGEWTECFNITGVVVPSAAFLGFSAHTGELSDNHDIIRVDANNLYTSEPGQSGAGDDTGVGHGSASGQGSRNHDWDRKHVDHHRAGWSGMLLKIVFILFAIGLTYIGFTVWRANQKRGSRF